MIVDFRDPWTKELWIEGRSRRFAAGVLKVARRKLAILHLASRLQDLRVPPGNKLEALRGSWAHQHSIRINNQYRICFEWRNGNAYGVEIVDYH